MEVGCNISTGKEEGGGKEGGKVKEDGGEGEREENGKSSRDRHR
jgi:hypothetical protein